VDGKHKGLTDQNDKWKDCDFIDFSSEGDSDEYDPFTDDDLALWDRVAAALRKDSGQTDPSSRGHPSNNPKCGGNQADSLPSQVKTDSRNTTPKNLQYMM
jgi:hypothetical protein